MSDLPLISIGSVHEQASRWFERASASILGALPCGRGCSSCCVGPFPITVLDADLLRQGLQSLPSGVRERIQANATRQAAAFEYEFPRLARSPFVDDWPEADLDAVTEHFSHVPCAALTPDGRCQVYAFRPVTCRTMGIPTESDSLVHGACDVQTSVPVVRLPQAFRDQENELVMQEAAALLNRSGSSARGEELLMPYGLLPGAMPGQVSGDEL